MPSYAGSGNYTLRVRGSTLSVLGGILFENETRLEFEAKHVSLFIQTDKYLYNRRQWSKCDNSHQLCYFIVQISHENARQKPTEIELFNDVILVYHVQIFHKN